MRAHADGSDLDWPDTDRRAVDLIRVLAMDAVEQAGGVAARVVSMPCLEWFTEQDCVGPEHFCAPADYKELYAEFGITAERAARAAHASLATVTAAGGRR